MEEKHKKILKWIILIAIVGGGLFYLIVLKPTADRGGLPEYWCDWPPC